MLITWQQGLRAEATYLKHAKSEEHYARSFTGTITTQHMADQSFNGSESDGDGEGERVLIHIGSTYSGNLDLQTF